MIKMAPQVESHINEEETKKKITEPIELTFYKEGQTWLAYDEFLWNNGMKGSCTMVAGTPELLDMLAEGETKITLLIAQDYISDYKLYLVRASENSFDGEMGGDYLVAGTDHGDASFGNYKCWLCQVAKFIFGWYPQVMFIKVIKN